MRASNDCGKALSRWLFKLQPVRPSPQLSFLYHTSTLQQRTSAGPQKPRHTTQANDGLELSFKDAFPGYHDDELDQDSLPDSEAPARRRGRTDDYLPIVGLEEASKDNEDPADSQTLQGHTMTGPERAKFERLFRLVASSPKPTPTTATAKSNSDPTKAQTEGKQADTKPDGKGAKITRHKLNRPKISEEEALLRFPAPLRPLAAAAVQTIKEREQAGTIGGPEETQDPAVRAQQQEFKRIKGLLRAAETDFELWKVLDTEVFSVIRRLDLDKIGDNAQEPDLQKSEKRRRRRARRSPNKQEKDAQGTTLGAENPRNPLKEGQAGTSGSASVKPGADSQVSTAKANDEPKSEKISSASSSSHTSNASSGKPSASRQTAAPHQNNGASSVKPLPAPELTDLAIIGPNYPLLLTAAVRQLRHRFPLSTLTMAFLPTIKGLGRSSYALGASTGLYNQLISIIWKTYADSHSIAGLLEEMDNGGISFNSRTLEILDRIHSQQTDFMRGWAGESLTIIWNLKGTQAGFRKLERWRTTVRHRLETEAALDANEPEYLGEDIPDAS